MVASMVVFEDGLPRKSEYRRFAIRGTGARDPEAAVTEGGDVDWIREAVRRRMARYLDERMDSGEEGVDRPAEAGGAPAGLDPETGRPRKFAYPPNLLVVDGGAPQVAAAARRAGRARHRRRRAVRAGQAAGGGLAARRGPTRSSCRAPPRGCTCCSGYGTRRTGSRSRTTGRSGRKAMTTSALDGVPGLGETRRKALLTRFGSLKRLRAASVEDIMAVPGVGRRTAEAVVRGAAPAGRRRPARRWTRSPGEVLDG